MMPNIAFVNGCLSFLLHYELTVASLGFGEECSNGLEQQNFSNVIDGSVTISSKFDVLTKDPLLGKLVILPMLFLVVQDSTFLCDCTIDTGECVVPKMTHTLDIPYQFETFFR